MIYPIPQNIFSNISKITPGMPSNPAINAVIILSPIWKLNEVPTMFISQIAKPPSIELVSIVIIFFTGNKRIFPNIKIKIIQVINEISIVISIKITQ